MTLPKLTDNAKAALGWAATGAVAVLSVVFGAVREGLTIGGCITVGAAIVWGIVHATAALDRIADALECECDGDDDGGEELGIPEAEEPHVVIDLTGGLDAPARDGHHPQPRAKA